MSSTLRALTTPALILDEGKFEANIGRLLRRVPVSPDRMRPHLKSLKCEEAILHYEARGIHKFTVSTLAEADAFGNKRRDLFYAVPLAPAKVSRIAGLIQSGANISCLIDSIHSAKACGDAALLDGVILPIWVELDVDGFRTGAQAGLSFDETIIAVANHSALHLVGIMSYGGAAYENTDPTNTARLSERHRVALIEARVRVSEIVGYQILTSYGGTPGVLFAPSLDGFDELRCGIHGFGDLFQAGIGTCKIEDIALSVLTTVIAHVPQNNNLVVDAGALALSKDRSTQGYSFDAGYGIVTDIEGSVIDCLRVEKVSQELGMISMTDGTKLPYDIFPIGTLLRILPNHADLTAAAYPAYDVVKDSDLIGRWRRVNYW